MWVLCNVCFLRILPKALGNRTPPPLLCRTLSRREGFWSKTKTQQKKQKSNKCGVVFAHSTTYSTERKEKTLDKGRTKLLLVDVKYRRKQSRYQIFKAAQWRKNFRNCAKLLFFFRTIFCAGGICFESDEMQVWVLRRRLFTPSHSHLWFPAGSRRGHSGGGGGGRGMSCSNQPLRSGRGGVGRSEGKAIELDFPLDFT